MYFPGEFYSGRGSSAGGCCGGVFLGDIVSEMLFDGFFG